MVVVCWPLTDPAARLASAPVRVCENKTGSVPVNCPSPFRSLKKSTMIGVLLAMVPVFLTVYLIITSLLTGELYLAVALIGVMANDVLVI